MKIETEFCDVEHEGDIEQVRQAIQNAGGSIIDYDHQYNAELLTVTIETNGKDPSDFYSLEWMGTKVDISNQGDGLGGSLY